MEHINIRDLEQFKSIPVEVAIQGEEGEEKPAFLHKKIKKLELCPDQTHLRIYFDHYYFFAVPLNAEVVHTENEWTGYDQNAGLYYVIRKGKNSGA